VPIYLKKNRCGLLELRVLDGWMQIIYIRLKWFEKIIYRDKFNAGVDEKLAGSGVTGT
jgi:hypothetical protein